MTRPGRPLGEIAQAALELACARPVHMFDLQQALQISRRDASVTLYNLRQRAVVVEFDRVMHPAARKPIARVTAAPPPGVEDKLAALAAWPMRRPVRG